MSIFTEWTNWLQGILHSLHLGGWPLGQHQRRLLVGAKTPNKNATRQNSPKTVMTTSPPVVKCCCSYIADTATKHSPKTPRLINLLKLILRIPIFFTSSVKCDPIIWIGHQTNPVLIFAFRRNQPQDGKRFLFRPQPIGMDSSARVSLSDSFAGDGAEERDALHPEPRLSAVTF